MDSLPIVGGECYFTRPIDALPTAYKDTFLQLPSFQTEIKKPPLDFSILDIRVGRIMRVTKNPANAEALQKSYLCKVEIGWERAPRYIVAELVDYYTREQLKLLRVVVLCNIPPVKCFGQRSWGWILAGRTPDGDIELLKPPNEYECSEQVTVWGYPPSRQLRDQPDLNAKKLKPLFKDMRISPDGEAQWQGLPMCVDDGTNPIRAGRYARDTPIVNAIKNRSLKSYKGETTAQMKKSLREFIG